MLYTRENITALITLNEGVYNNYDICCEKSQSNKSISLIIKTLNALVEFANSVDSDEAAHFEQSHSFEL